KNARKDDNVWTFGKKDESTGYMKIGQHRVHIIVARAFLGCKDSKIYVVDHIDTNRCNNRVDNLRWLTRLENVLMNPITCDRVAALCGGDITKFLKNPSCLRDLTGTNQDLAWMRTVTSEEATNAYNNVLTLRLKRYDPDKSYQKKQYDDKSEWIFKKNNYHVSNLNQVYQFVKAKSPITALQMNWKTPTMFPCCPAKFENNGLKDYFSRLQEGNFFSVNQFSTYKVVDCALIEKNTELLVVTKDITGTSVKPFGVVRIYASGGQFVHEIISTFFEENGAKQSYTEMQGLTWHGGESIDSYCM
ncbi:MAG: HNH endonuclease, partial [Bacteroidales bacterium]|nr:HNH endonuclease [Bacteroidales bacterium]